MNDAPYYALIATVVAIGFGAIFVAYHRMSANTDCLQAGYRTGSIDMYLNKYCIKRVDQTDVVIPLGKVKDGAN